MIHSKRRWLPAVAVLAVALGVADLARVEAADIADTSDRQAAGAAAPSASGQGFRRGRITGYPVPRFVSLRSASAHMRVGPSTDYATVWVYSARGLPIEITDEYGNWRRVRDQDGTSGWMFAPLLSGERTAVVGPWMNEPIALRSAPHSSASVVAMLSPAVRLDIRHCDGSWCNATVQSRRIGGYVAQADLWGVYPQERVE
jgi:SH3-like domain-containing protein